MNRIVCFHLFNEFSGSPKVLKTVLEGLLRKGCQVDLVTSKGGVLDELASHEHLRMHHYHYRFSHCHALTLCRYIMVQAYTFFLALRWMFRKDVVFYVNTVQPVGPALAGRLTGKHVVYHYHENAFVMGLFYRILARAMQLLAHQIICVSKYQASFLRCKEKTVVIPNALPQDFVDSVRPDAEAAFDRQTVLMLSSLKGYKGTMEFVRLSRRMPQYRFVIVINDTPQRTDSYIKAHCQHNALPQNLEVFSRQNNVVPFYQQASIVLNLSDKTLCIETFGLTALEAMRAGLPVIVPTVGGIAEMVADGVNGYKIDVQELNLIARRIEELLSQKDVYISFANNALKYALTSDVEAMLRKIIDVIRLKK